MICRNCKYWVEKPSGPETINFSAIPGLVRPPKAGTCYGRPPQVIIAPSAPGQPPGTLNAMCVRPDTSEADLACDFYQPLGMPYAEAPAQADVVVKQ